MEFLARECPVVAFPWVLGTARSSSGIAEPWTAAKVQKAASSKKRVFKAIIVIDTLKPALELLDKRSAKYSDRLVAARA